MKIGNSNKLFWSDYSYILIEIQSKSYNLSFLKLYLRSNINAIRITLQIEHSEESVTPPTPSTPIRETQSPEGIASLSSGSSDNALGKYVRLSTIKWNNNPFIYEWSMDP